MCGIGGFFGDFNPDLLKMILTGIKHRGPDDAGMFYDKNANIGLVHSRLAIQDLSPLGGQPMQSLDGYVQIIFNGEIYNFRELRRELESKSYKFRSHSDTEVLLNLYLEDKENFLSRLNGVFAFAIWDKRTQTLLIARDALGVKPLYYADVSNGVVFASEIKAMLPLLPQHGELDVLALYRYLGYLWSPGESTPLKSVRKLQPGEAMVISSDGIIKKWSWYQLPATSFKRVVRRSNVDWISSTAKYLRQAVHRQMVADVSVGSFLSGGLDSSAVVAFAKEVNPDIRCFTIEMEGGQEEGITDDLPFAKRVAQHLEVPLDIVSIDANKMAEDLEHMVVQLDEPLADPAPLNVLYISQLAREQGIKVLLSGAGGDDLFTGYRRHNALNLEKWWAWLPPSTRIALERQAGRLDQRRPWARRLAKLFNGAGLDGDERLTNYYLWGKKSDLLSLFVPEIREQLLGVNIAQPMIDFLSLYPSELSNLERMLLLEQRFFLSDHNLIYTDKMSMEKGVEVRVPFLDLELVEYAEQIPSRLKQHGTTGKWILKKAMEPYLPYDVIYRKKTGFGAPLRRWIRHELRELLGDHLSVDSIKKRGLFDAEVVQRLINDNDSGRIDAAYTLFSLLCIEIWCRNFIDGSTKFLKQYGVVV